VGVERTAVFKQCLNLGGGYLERGKEYFSDLASTASSQVSQWVESAASYLSTGVASAAQVVKQESSDCSSAFKAAKGRNRQQKEGTFQALDREAAGVINKADSLLDAAASKMWRP